MVNGRNNGDFGGFAEAFRLFDSYENAEMKRYSDFTPNGKGEFKTTEFDKLEEGSEGGIPLVAYKDGEGKIQISMTDDTHALVIGATRSGKSTGYVMPMINIKAHQKRKDNMFITDPKGELYSLYADMLRAKGYKVLLLNFRDSRHSEFWNPLTPLFRNYRKGQEVEQEIKAVKRNKKYLFEFNGKEFESKEELDKAVRQVKFEYNLTVDKEIQNLTQYFIPIQPNARDPYWDLCAQNSFRAFLYAMLEDSNLPEGHQNRITEETFSLKTIIEVFNNFHAPSGESSVDIDGGYFSDRDKSGKPYQWISQSLFIAAKQTASCVFSSFASHLWRYQDVNTMLLTASNTFNIDDLAGEEQPVAVFVAFRDEISESYLLIQNFIASVYKRLIERADGMGGALKRPFYFVLDEFGNLPGIKDFEHVISACGGRNIWFVLVIQSYAQLQSLYGQTAEIIKDNLGMHIFFGTNNHDTKVAFSRECGQKTTVSPESALNGRGVSMQEFRFSTLPLIPVSRLNCVPHECIITRMMGEVPVVKSRIERTYCCPDVYARHAKTSLLEYQPSREMDISDPVYNYRFKFDFSWRRSSSRRSFDY